MLLKKIGMCSIYFFIGRLAYWLTGVIGIGNNNGGNGYTYPQILVIGIVLCAISCYLRDGKLKREHKGDESKEKVIFNSSLKEKIKFIVATTDFKIETALHIIVAFITIMIPLTESAVAYGFMAVFAVSRTIMIIILWMILMPVYMAVLNVISWTLAYNKCYRRKEF